MPTNDAGVNSCVGVKARGAAGGAWLVAHLLTHRGRRRDFASAVLMNVHNVNGFTGASAADRSATQRTSFLSCLLTWSLNWGADVGFVYPSYMKLIFSFKN